MERSNTATQRIGSPEGSHMRQSGTTPIIAWSRTFLATPDRVREARQFLTGILDGGPATDDAVLCLSELVTNACLHSDSHEPGGKYTVCAQLNDGTLKVEVSDSGGPWTWSDYPDEQHGRGLLIVAQLAQAWGRTGDAASGWTVWYEIAWPLSQQAQLLTTDRADTENGREPADSEPGPGRNHRWIRTMDGQRLRELRRQRGLTQVELARKAQVSAAAVARLERQIQSSCRSRTLVRLAAALGTDPAVLMTSACPRVLTSAPGPSAGQFQDPGGSPLATGAAESLADSPESPAPSRPAP
jgi:transcriptional regulator with XRE-family HTH domain/anti-sigma regulatory factor (Ser/Thr protein kinase)